MRHGIEFHFKRHRQENIGAIQDALINRYYKSIIEVEISDAWASII